MDELAADLAALRLMIEWGADEALLEEPQDRFAAAPVPLPVRLPVPPSAPPSAPLSARGAAPADRPGFQAPARPAARPAAFPPVAAAPAATDLAGLHEEMDRAASPLRATASHTVGPVGNPASGLLLVGEAPGPDDDRSGQAFAGAPGATMDRVLGSAGLTREHAMLAFLVPWRPPGGRKPTDAELAFCLPYMHRLLLIARPRRMVLMSGLALRVLAGDGGGIRRARGRWTEVAVPGADPIPALPMLPPELWLGSAASRAATWADLLALRSALDA